MSKEGLLLGISLSFPGDLDAGMTPWYHEFRSIKQFIDYTNIELQKVEPGCMDIKTFKKAEEYWKEDGCMINIITPEWCKIHQNYWAKYGNSLCNACPQCDEENGMKDLENHYNETYNRT